MRVLTLIILLFTLTFGTEVYRVVSYEGVDLNNHTGQHQLTTTDISEITVNENYVELKGMNSNNDQVGKSYLVYNNHMIKTADNSIYYFMAIEDDGDIYSITLEFLKKLVVVNMSKDMIEIYHLEYLGDE
jgi:hypothetical protein